MRARNLVRAFQELGCSVTVFTPRSAENGIAPPGAIAIRWIDLERIGKQVGLDRFTQVTRSLGHSEGLRENIFRSLARRFVIPDLYAPWIPLALFRARRAVKEAAVVVSTGAPSSHVVARLLSRGKIWIADINDLWWKNPHADHGSARDWLDRHFERRVLGRANALTTVNGVMKSELRTRFDLPVMSLYSGYEPDDFEPEVEERDNVEATAELVFAGTLYPAFDTAPILEGIARGKQEGWLRADALQVVFVGGGSWRATVEAERRGVSEFVVALPRMQRQELLSRLSRASALILPLYERDPYSLPMRFFEYVGSGRPIVAVGPQHRLAARLVIDNGLGVGASDPGEFVDFLRRLASSQVAVSPERRSRERFSCREMVPRLRRLLADVQSRPILLAISIAATGS